LKKLLIAIRSITDEVYIFQHDSSLAHRAYQTVELLCREKPKFTAFDMWLPNSPDIKPVDYCILASDASCRSKSTTCRYRTWHSCGRGRWTRGLIVVDEAVDQRKKD